MTTWRKACLGICIAGLLVAFANGRVLAEELVNCSVASAGTRGVPSSAPGGPASPENPATVTLAQLASQLGKPVKLDSAGTAKPFRRMCRLPCRSAKHQPQRARGRPAQSLAFWAKALSGISVRPFGELSA